LETTTSLAPASGVAQLLQKRALSVLSDWHLGHWMVTYNPFFQVWLKRNGDKSLAMLEKLQTEKSALLPAKARAIFIPRTPI
jgi:hypothetical protein